MKCLLHLGPTFHFDSPGRENNYSILLGGTQKERSSDFNFDEVHYDAMTKNEPKNKVLIVAELRWSLLAEQLASNRNSCLRQKRGMHFHPI